jgi:hypothetical protein
MKNTISWPVAGMLGVAVGMLIPLSACKSPEQNQLENVNKDWNRLIRASHIYPIYPLSQDIQPGDVFFTQTDIEDTSLWTATNGYLPFDRHVARLYPANYGAFYTNSFSIGHSNALPRHWLENNGWSNAPVAAFPTYSFTVRQGAGAHVSLPIQGIPIGLSLMGARQASGFVTIADSHTYGIDELSLKKQVTEFIAKYPDQILGCFPNGRGDTNQCYLQVVSRVYTTGRVAISMLHDSESGGSLSGGAPKDVSIPGVGSTNNAENYTNMISAVNNVIESNKAGSLAPGGTIKFVHVSNRSVSLQETFPRPIVIGYVGFTVQLSAQSLREAVTNLSRFNTELDIDARRAIESLVAIREHIGSTNVVAAAQVTNSIALLNNLLATNAPFAEKLASRDRVLANLTTLNQGQQLPAAARTNLTNSIQVLRDLPETAENPAQQISLRFESLGSLERKLHKKK